MITTLLYIAYFCGKIAKEAAEEMRSCTTIEEADMWANILFEALNLRDEILSHLTPTFVTYEVIDDGVYTYELPFYHYIYDGVDLTVLCEGEPPLWIPVRPSPKWNSESGDNT